MNKIFNHKLFEIFFEKALIALILLLASLLTNQALERYKLIEMQRVAGTTAFVSACQEIWSKIYEYEDTVNDVTSIRSSRWLLKSLGEKNLKDKDVEIEKKSKLKEQQLNDLRKLTNERKFVIGHNFVMHFWKYVGLVEARADAKNTAQEKEGYEAKISQDAVEAFDKKIASMRFTSDMAREYAISQLPR
ncbi:MAG: hypothetical protein K9L79_03010 [Methylobacter tundripaludum]|nr:hypothetical protein [Methylobacter tundripaludum]